MYFGEIALLGAKDKQATVTAAGGALKGERRREKWKIYT